MPKKITKSIFGLLVFAIVLLLQHQFHDHPSVVALTERGGYLGVAAFTFVNSFNFLVPIVTSTLVPTWASGGLNPIVVVGMIVVIMTAVDMFGYVIGRYAHHSVNRIRHAAMFEKIRHLRERSLFLPYLILGFWVLLMPLPNEIITGILGILGCRIAPVFSVVFVGNVVFHSVVSYLAFSAT